MRFLFIQLECFEEYFSTESRQLNLHDWIRNIEENGLICSHVNDSLEDDYFALKS